MRDFTIQQGETLRLLVTVDEEGADSAELVVTDGTTDLITNTVSFVGLEADLTTNDTIIPVGSYDYYIRVTWDDGTSDIIPDVTDCDGDCEFPQLIICEVPGVS